MVLAAGLLRDEQFVEEVRKSETKRFRNVQNVDESLRLYRLSNSLNYQKECLYRLKNKVGQKMKEFYKNSVKKPQGEANPDQGQINDVLQKIMELNLANENRDSTVASTKNTEIDGMINIFDVESLKKFQVELGKQIKDIEDRAEESTKAFKKLWATIGNILHEDVVVSQDEDNNKLIKTSGDVTQTKKYSHVDLCAMIGGLDTVRGAKVMGSRGYYMTGPLYLLSQALQIYAMQFLADKDYTPIQTPYMMTKQAMTAVSQLSQFDEELYKVTGKWMNNTNNDVKTQNGSQTNPADADEKYLIATSEQPLAAMYSNEYIELVDGPMKIAGYSTCFRQEAGSHGRDTKGMFRVHQFEKIEQFVYCKPEESWDEFEKLLNTVYEFYDSLNIPYRTVSIVSGEMNDAAAKKYDVEGYFPSSGTFRELVSCSNCTDYQSRGANIRYGVSGTAKAPFVHLLNSTLCAVTRVLCIILELYQTEEGIMVPEPLQKFMTNKYKKMIPFVRGPLEK